MQHLLTIRSNLGDTITTPLASITRIERNDRSLVILDGSVDAAVMTFDSMASAFIAEATAIEALEAYLAFAHVVDGVML